jgi:prolactin regulatory element-binding protein
LCLFSPAISNSCGLSLQWQAVPNTCLHICRLLAIGSCEGDVAIVDAATLSIQQRVRQAHMIFVTAMEFDPNGQAVLTVSADYSARVTPIEPVGGDAWRGSVLLIVIFVLAMLVVIVGDGLLANSPQAASVSEFLARLKSRSLKLTPDGGV